MSSLASLKQLHELCHLRSMLEVFAASRVMAGPTREKVIGKLQGELEILHRHARAANQADFHQADRRFHRILIESAEIPALTGSWELVAADLDIWWRHVKERYWPHLMSLYDEHVILLESLQSPLAWVVEQSLHQHLESGWYRVASSRGEPAYAPDPVARADAYMATHFASRLEMEFLAHHIAFTSTSHLNRLFRQKLGTSPYARLKSIRLERGAELLLTSAYEVREVAKQVGYRSAAHFVRDFRAFHGHTPGQHRASQE